MGLVGTVATSYRWSQRAGPAGAGWGSWVYASKDARLLVYDARDGKLHAKATIGGLHFVSQGDWVVLYEPYLRTSAWARAQEPFELRGWNARSKELIWIRPHDGAGCFPTIRGDVIVMDCETRTIVRALEDGRRLWSREGEVFLGRAQDTIVVRDSGPTVGRDVRTGKRLWTHPNLWNATICVHGGSVYMMTSDEVRRLDVVTGGVVARRTLPRIKTRSEGNTGSTPEIGCLRPSRRSRVSYMPLHEAPVEPGTPLLVNVDDRSYVLEADSLQVRWQLEERARLYAATRDILILETGPRTTAYQSQNGNKLWQWREPVARAVHSGRLLYEVTNDRVEVCDLESGRKLWERGL